MHALTEIAQGRLVKWVPLCPRKFARWRARYGKANEHNGQVPRDHWLEPVEKQAIIAFAKEHPLEGYRSLSFMMLDRDVAAVAPATAYRVLKAAGLIGRAAGKPSRKGSGFVQPLAPHEHWHIDFSYLNIGGTFYFLCVVLDGCSRAVLAWDIRPTMREADAEIVVQKAREASPQARPRVISDQGSQFKSREFKAFITLWQASHVMTSPYYPQSNGKLERFHKTLKEQAIHPKTPLTLEDAKRIVGEFINYYNDTRLHSAIGYIAPHDRLAGRQDEIHAARDKKLEAAREARKLKRQIHHSNRQQTILAVA
ncbi:MAG: transposase [Verrucomicrobiales bacterium]